MEIEHLKLSQIKPPANPVRTDRGQEDLDELCESMCNIGLLYPIRVKKSNGNFEIIDGDRRFQAAERAGWTEIPAIVEQDGKRDYLEEMLASNVARLNMSSMEEAAFFKDCLDQKGLSYRQLSAKIGKTLNYIKRRVDLLSLPPELQRYLHEGKINQDQANALARIDDEATRLNWLADTVHRGTSAKTLWDWVGIHRENQYEQERRLKPHDTLQDAVPEAEYFGQCEICGRRFHFSRLRSMVVDAECASLSRLFYREYMAYERNNNGGDRDSGPGDALPARAEVGENRADAQRHEINDPAMGAEQ